MNPLGGTNLRASSGSALARRSRFARFVALLDLMSTVDSLEKELMIRTQS